ncbi:hypothetical protein PMAYCL1PPCAC_15946, partial [Pristionchus mayeri]
PPLPSPLPSFPPREPLPEIIPSPFAAMDPAPMSSMEEPMVLHFGATETVLFSFWNIETTLGLILSCLLVIIMCMIKEAARAGRSFYAKYTENNRSISSRIIDASLHFVVLAISYLLMAIFMELNVWMCITIMVAEVLTHAVSSYCSSAVNVNFFEK